MTDELQQPKTRKRHIRPALRDALSLIVTEGRSITEAAQTVGMARETLSKALKKPHVIEAKADLVRAWRASRTEKAVLTVADLAVNATSEDVRLKASRTWLELVGELGPNRRDDAPRAAQLVQIVIGSDRDRPDITVTAGEHGGVYELPPYTPANLTGDGPD